jgi:purine-binding chemotaxis protein CheW
MSSASETATSSPPSGIDAEGLAGKYLTFRLATEEYGVQILKVREIIAVLGITPLPSMHPSMKGVINLRGKIIPVVDLRLKLGLEASEFTERTCIIVTEVDAGQDGESVQIGCIVDTVSEVLDIGNGDIEPPPTFGGKVTTDYLRGLGKIDEKDMVVALLDIDRVLSEMDMASLASETEASTEQGVPS